MTAKPRTPQVSLHNMTEAEDFDEDMHIEIDVPQVTDNKIKPYIGTAQDALLEDLARSGLAPSDIHASI